MSAERTHFVYRCYDSGGTLLYVGMSKDPVRRFKHHRATKQLWYEQVAAVRMVGPLLHDEATDLERLLILKAAPRHNKVRPLPRRSAHDTWAHVLREEVERVKAAA